MYIENKIFERHLPDFDKLAKYGFKSEGDYYYFEKLFYGGEFRAIIKISKEGDLKCSVYEFESGEEFLPLRISDNQGRFVNEVREKYCELLEDIRNNCYIRKFFIFPQTNRIGDLINKKYGSDPEFLWDKFKGTAIFRNKQSAKWYAAVIDVDRSKIQENKKGLVEVLDIKLEKEQVEEITKQEHFYQGYHMNKKHWITIILDDSVQDEKIMELVEKSYNLSKKK
ncbi:MmcQ/YjbR family DNA-binding protein [bacterium]|nr:MmcQ/YjbR family DNA-binding protein [bacterium]